MWRSADLRRQRWPLCASSAVTALFSRNWPGVAEADDNEEWDLEQIKAVRLQEFSVHICSLRAGPCGHRVKRPNCPALRQLAICS